MTPLDLTYMGTKRQLSPAIAEIVCAAKKGIALDLFSGMCAIGSAIAPRRQVWNNDIQRFAASVAAALFTPSSQPPRPQIVADRLYEYYRHNHEVLSTRYRQQIEKERATLNAKQISPVKEYLSTYKDSHLNPQALTELAQLRSNPSQFPYRLFSLLYADTYFGVSQCVEIDSIVYAIQASAKDREFTPSQRLWLILSLGRALQRIATTTGHFAQYLEPKNATLSRYLVQRDKPVWDTWLYSIPMEGPIATEDWRKGNLVFNQDSLQLLSNLRRRKIRPSVVYADPPYTKDQYSRYYHVLETLLTYDYPKVSGKGRYRDDRFFTPFSHKRTAVNAFRKMAAQTAALEADIVVSYPANGLLNQLKVDPQALLKEHFRKVLVCLKTTHFHSTMGASKGTAAESVTEVVYWGAL
ncbi:MAG TPA: DNA adenine methylase [Burkholderiales bacterium]|nr:DNA adenine methylase [Burkholderiales bacterium]